jgi:phenylalanyl-tRNA synthetase beta chain
MATVTFNFPDLVKLIGLDLSLDKVREVMFELGSETEDIQGDEVTFEVTSDRADLLSVEGIARMLRAYYGVETGLKVPRLHKSDYRLIVNREVGPVRPYVTGAIVRNVSFTDESIKSLMHLQEKLHGTFGRKRKKGAVGVHDLAKIKGKEIHYRAVPADSVRFVPLQSDEMMTLADVLTKHPKGIDFSYVLEGKKLMPIITDEEGIFSFPPIINSKRTEVTLNTHDLLIELTGEDLRTIDYMLNIVLYSLDLRGATIYTLDVLYPDRTLSRPNFDIRNINIEVEYANKLLGLDLTSPDIKSLLERMGFGVPEAGSDYVAVEIPPYRADILHKRDVVDDVGRAFGYNNITPSYPNTPSVGKLTENTKLGDAIRSVMVGLGCQDTFNFLLIGKDEVFAKMNRPLDGSVVEISNPYAEQYNIVRPSLIPSLMIVLSNMRI